ncbi:N [Symbiodinium sp. CCMP2456]|nr:N [Symbiodinium sp. CCMP2456] [Symbiodinium sp. CCMP2456]
MWSKGQLLLFVWLILVCCLASRAARAFDSEFLESSTEDEALNLASRKTWGDLFGEVREALWQLDFVWFLAVVLISVAIVLYKPPEIVGDTADDGVVDKKWKPVAWHSRLIASLTSHAAGIAGFVGFQWIVVARIVSTSRPLENFSPSNVLLYTSIAISVTAIFSSILFLVQDYLRRLVIDSAQGRGYRLSLECGQLEQTGLGAALIVLTAVLLFLYMCVIFLETQENTKFHNREKQEILWVVLEKVYSCGTVLLYFINLRGLCKSPKVFFHQACLRAEPEIKLKEFLEEFSSSRSEGLVQQVRNFLAWLAQRLAGEDLKLFLQLGSRRALFPNQRLAPILHVVAGLLLFGMLPGMCQFATERLFVDPKFVDVRAYSATIFPSFNPNRSNYLLLLDRDPRLQVKTKSRHTSSIKMCCYPSDQPCESRRLHHSLIQFDDDPITLKVPANESSSCTLTASGLSSHASAVLKLKVEFQAKYQLCDCSTNNGCDCCDGYTGELGDDWDQLNLSTACEPAPCNINNSNKAKGWDCACLPQYVGSISWKGSTPKGTCSVAPCEVENSNRQAGPQCKCMDGYRGQVTWSNSSAEGQCLPAACEDRVPNSTGRGLDCKCQSGFAGQIRWNGSRPRGSCDPVPCKILNSNRRAGPGCACLDAFIGSIFWTGAHAEGTCEPASCEDILHSTGRGAECRCQNGFAGNITWKRGKAAGSCEPAPCHVKNSNRKPGRDCSCSDAFVGNISWTGPHAEGACKPKPLPCKDSIPHSYGESPECLCQDGFKGVTPVVTGVRMLKHCRPAPCDVAGSNKLQGLACACGRGHFGHVRWEGDNAEGACRPLGCKGRHATGFGDECRCKDGYVGTVRRSKNVNFSIAHCKPAPCDVEGSNFRPGWNCSCADGFSGSVRWNKDESRGRCKPTPCTIQNSNLEPGPKCRCKPGFEGNITWNGPSVSGHCEPVPCGVRNSNFGLGPACRCANGFFGLITWSGAVASGTCVPAPLCSSSIAFVTHLKADLDPSSTSSTSCKAGQAVLARGHSDIEFGRQAITWTLAEPIPQNSCHMPSSAVQMLENTWSFPVGCSTTPARPRCSSDIVYPITVVNDSRHSCSNCSLDGYALAEFRGRRCGYDLIQWDFFTVSPGSSASCDCFLHLECGQPPTDELPRSCSHFSEPAVLEFMEDTVTWMYMLFDNGVASLSSLDSGLDWGGNAEWQAKDAAATATSSPSDAWYFDGECLSVRRAPPFSDWIIRLVINDGSVFNSTKDGLVRVAGVPPPWWSYNFQKDATLPGSFNADKLLGHKVVFSSLGVCYSAELGKEFLTVPAQGDCASQVFASHAGTRYMYLSSAFGIQTYRSERSCFPLAAFEELQLEVVDVTTAKGDDNFTVSISPCRTYVRFVVDAEPRQSHCRSIGKDDPWLVPT